MTDHDRVYPVEDGRTFIITARDFGGTRISTNFNHLSWVPRGSEPVRVRFTIHGVDETVRQGLQVHLKVDKRARKDRDRGGDVLQDGSEFDLAYGTDGDRAYYFVERGGTIKGQDLPVEAYFRLDRID